MSFPLSSNEMTTILVISDEPRVLDLGRMALPEYDLLGPTLCAGDLLDLLKSCHGRPDLVWIAGTRTEKGTRELPAILDVLRTRCPRAPILYTLSRAEGLLSETSEARGEGSWSFFLDDDVLDAQGLRSRIEEILALKRTPVSEGDIYWGRGMDTSRLRQRLHVLARGRLPVVLLGATGTGKTLLARDVIHPRSGQSGEFVCVDLATLPRDLMAAHLFGVARGAYTGASQDRQGAFERANRGTLFLDEIGNLSDDAQKMLLSVLQERCVTRLGEVKERRVDVKLVVATHENLSQRVQQGDFRQDLYMRLNPAMAIELPALVDRTLDWPGMVEHALYTVLRQPGMQVEVQSYVEPHGLPPRRVRVVCGRRVPATRSRHLVVWVPPASMDLLQTHSWPGNFREFSMWAENALWLALAEAQSATGLVRPEVLVLRPALVSQWLQRATCRPDDPASDTHRVTVRAHATLHEVASSCERQYFESLYRETGGDFSLMAERLLGDGSAARKVQLRFNQLGLRVRGFRHIVMA